MSGRVFSLRASTDTRYVLLLALVIAFGLQWKSCIEPNRMNDDWREHAHWRTPSSQHFHPDDRLVRYQQFHSAPFANALYTTLSRTGIDAAWGKFNGIAWFVLTALLVFGTARALAPGRIAGWAAAVTFVLFPCMMAPFVGGLMPGLATLLLCGVLLAVATGRWWWSVPLVLFQGLVDPAAAVHAAVIVVVVGWRRQRAVAALAALACGVVVGAGYAFGSNEFGELVTRANIGNRLEFSVAGPAELLPTPSFAAVLWRHLGSASYVATSLAAFLVLGRRMFALPSPLVALIFTTLGLFAVADVVLMHLGVPAEFTARGLPLFAALTTGVWVARMIARESQPRPILAKPLFDLRASPAVLAVAAIALIGLVEHRTTFAPRGDLETQHFDRTALYETIRALPHGVMLASHPRTASELPLMTGRSVVISSKLAQPWWTGHWEWSEERIRDVLRAYFAVDPKVLVEVTRKYGIDYWVVDLRRYRAATRAYAAMDYEPFRSWARRNLDYAGRSVLERMPARYRAWQSGRTFFIVTAADVERRAAELVRPQMTEGRAR